MKSCLPHALTCNYLLCGLHLGLTCSWWFVHKLTATNGCVNDVPTHIVIQSLKPAVEVVWVAFDHVYFVVSTLTHPYVSQQDWPTLRSCPNVTDFTVYTNLLKRKTFSLMVNMSKFKNGHQYRIPHCRLFRNGCFFLHLEQGSEIWSHVKASVGMVSIAKCQLTDLEL